MLQALLSVSCAQLQARLSFLLPVGLLPQAAALIAVRERAMADAGRANSVAAHDRRLNAGARCEHAV